MYDNISNNNTNDEKKKNEISGISQDVQELMYLTSPRLVTERLVGSIES